MTPLTRGQPVSHPDLAKLQNPLVPDDSPPSNDQSRSNSHRNRRTIDRRLTEVSLAEIFRRYGPAYRAKYGPSMLPSHRQVMAAIEQCRTRPIPAEDLRQVTHGNSAIKSLMIWVAETCPSTVKWV